MRPAPAPLAPPGVLASARCADGPLLDVEGARRWLGERRREQRYEVARIPFTDLRGWRFETASGDLVHESGRFFRVQGVRVRCEVPGRLAFEQPIIHQPDVGILGILAKRFDGVLHFLLQAKMEPGNVDLVQLSPTVQATRSNYTRVHGGARPRYLDFFAGRAGHRVLVDQLQSEQGLFFLRKRNRSIIVETEADVVVHEDFRWLTLGQIKALLGQRHTVNMDTRTVIAALPLVSSAAEARAAGCAPREDAATFADALVASTLAGRGSRSIEAVLGWLTRRRANAAVDTQPCALGALHGWERDAHEVRRLDGRYFTVFGIAVCSDSREVGSWTQPVVQPVAPGVSALVTKRIGGILHVLVQARMEPGVWNLVELGPTVQYLRDAPVEGTGAPFMLREVLAGAAGVTRHRSTQCEEGGRFYRYATEHIVTELDERDDRPVPEAYAWLTLAQLNTLIRHGHHVNSEARSVLACLDVQAV